MSRRESRRPVSPLRPVAEPRVRSDDVWLDPRTFARDFERLLTDDDRRDLRLAADAEARGDAAAAIMHLRYVPRVVGSPHDHHLHELRDLGPDAPDWVWARWVVAQSYGRLLVERDLRLVDAVARTVAVAYPDVDLATPLGLDPVEFFTWVRASDWICEQLATFELGGLADFLDGSAGPGLLRRAGRVREWVDARMAGYRVEGARRGRLLLRDLRDDRRVETLDLGLRADRDDGGCVVGRLVPVDAEPGLMFDRPPLRVPDQVAVEAGELVSREGPDAWLRALAEGRRRGLLDEHFSHGHVTPLTSDVVPASWTSAPHQDLESALQVCEVALRKVESEPEETERAAVRAIAVLMDSRVYAAAWRRWCGTGHRAAWELIAQCAPEPVRSRCRRLARASRPAA